MDGSGRGLGTCQGQGQHEGRLGGEGIAGGASVGHGQARRAFGVGEGGKILRGVETRTPSSFMGIKIRRMDCVCVTKTVRWKQSPMTRPLKPPKIQRIFVRS